MTPLRSEPISFVTRDARRLAWTAGEISQWCTARGTVTEHVQGNQVNYYVRLESLASKLFAFLVVAGGIGLSIVFWEIVYAFISGRVHAVLHAIETSFGQ